MTFSYISDNGLNIINNVTNITGITSTYSVSLTDSIIYSTDASPHVLILPLAAQAGVGKTYTLSPLFGWEYQIFFQGSDQTNGDIGSNPIITNNITASLTSNGISIWIVTSGTVTD